MAKPSTHMTRNRGVDEFLERHHAPLEISRTRLPPLPKPALGAPLTRRSDARGRRYERKGTFSFGADGQWGRYSPPRSRKGSRMPPLRFLPPRPQARARFTKTAHRTQRKQRQKQKNESEASAPAIATPTRPSSEHHRDALADLGSKFPARYGNEQEWAARVEKRLAARMARNRTALRNKCLQRIEHLGGMRTLFETLDLDGNGTLDRHEIAHMMDSLKIPKVGDDRAFLWGELDADNNGVIEYHEFYTWVTRIDREPRVQDAKLKRIWELAQRMRQGHQHAQRKKARNKRLRGVHGREREQELAEQAAWRSTPSKGGLFKSTSNS